MILVMMIATSLTTFEIEEANVNIWVIKPNLAMCS